MATRKLDKAAWRGFSDRVSKALVGKRAEIEVASLALGDQVEAEWLPLLGITYDPKDDIFEVALDGGVDHIITAPRALYVDEDAPGALVNLEIVDGEDVRHIIVLRDPLMLPPPSAVSG
jgi:Family of unknown function (DUF5335)